MTGITGFSSYSCTCKGQFRTGNSVQLINTVTTLSMTDLQRSIPSMADGFNLIQRKILFCAFKKNLIKTEEVVHFSDYVLDNCAYDHSEGDVADAIIGMAQDYVGTNNVNLFIPDAQFGTRIPYIRHLFNSFE